jgi:hypothetical protein
VIIDNETRERLRRLVKHEAQYPNLLRNNLGIPARGTTSDAIIGHACEEIQKILDKLAPPEPTYKVVRTITYEGTIAQLYNQLDIPGRGLAPGTHRPNPGGLVITIAMIEDTRPKTEIHSRIETDESLGDA